MNPANGTIDTLLNVDADPLDTADEDVPLEAAEDGLLELGVGVGPGPLITAPPLPPGYVPPGLPMKS